MKKDKVIKLKIGCIGKKTFYVSKGGYFFPARANVAKEELHQTTLSQMSEFGRAAHHGKLLRMAFKPLLHQVREAGRPTRSNRLTAKLLEVLWHDTTHKPGKRTPMQGDRKLLMHFDFNLSANFEWTFPVSYVPSINRETGILKVEIPAFAPGDELHMPAGATHFQMVAAGAAMDFVHSADRSELAASAVIGVDQERVEAMVLQCTLPKGSTKALFLVFGVLFFQEVQGTRKMVQDGQANCLRIVAVQ